MAAGHNRESRHILTNGLETQRSSGEIGTGVACLRKRDEGWDCLVNFLSDTASLERETLETIRQYVFTDRLTGSTSY
jgi:hypothetical protein